MRPSFRGTLLAAFLAGAAAFAQAQRGGAPAGAAKRGDYLVGAHYFAGWWSNPPSRFASPVYDWRPMFPEREPVPGWSDDRQEVMHWEIDQAASHGLAIHSRPAPC